MAGIFLETLKQLTKAGFTVRFSMSHRDSSCEHQEHMLKIMGRFYAEFVCLSKPVRQCVTE